MQYFYAFPKLCFLRLNVEIGEGRTCNFSEVQRGCVGVQNRAGGFGSVCENPANRDYESRWRIEITNRVGGVWEAGPRVALCVRRWCRQRSL